MNPEQEQEWREEAKQIALLSVELQKQIVALHRHVASNPALAKHEREEGLAHADELEEQLKKLNRRAKNKGK